ncbi:MAG: ribonuclease PH [Holosporaceae bacterium]|nr:ribonuclease PH [Holosporaceae bacterium]
MRISGRKNDEIRKIEIIPNYLMHADGSCLISFGDTKVICTATVEEKVPPFLKGSGHGWITAEYSLLPCSANTRTEREAVRGKQSGRTHEIQRLIGRSLRASFDLTALGERQIRADCDVIQADGGTRTASICGACVALRLALKQMRFRQNPLKHLVGAISCAIVDGEILADPDYNEDSRAEVDANFVMTESGEAAEVQASGENGLFDEKRLIEMLAVARKGIGRIFEIQKAALAD